MSGRRAERTVEVSRAQNEVFDAILRVLPGVRGLRVVSADAAAGRIVAKTGISLASYGENVTIALAPLPSGGTRMAIRSSLRWGLMDWGRNRTNIDRILVGLDRLLAAERPAAEPPSAPLPPPPPP